MHCYDSCNMSLYDIDPEELEGKRTEMKGWKGPREAREVIRRSRARYLATHAESKTE